MCTSPINIAQLQYHSAGDYGEDCRERYPPPETWTKAGRIWYVTLTEKVKPLTQFQQFARMTFDAARSLFNADGTEQAVKAAWVGVGVKI